MAELSWLEPSGALLERVVRESAVPRADIVEAVETAASPELALARSLDLPGGAAGVKSLERAERVALFSLLGGSAHLGRVLLAIGGWREWLVATAAGAGETEPLDVVKLVQAGARDVATGQAQLRRWRQRAFLRIGARDLWQLASVRETLASLSATAETAIRAATVLARAQMEAEHGRLVLPSGMPNRFVVLGMGKLGARELNYSSDVDLIFLHEGQGAPSSGGPRGALAPARYFTRLGERVARLLSEVTGDGFVFRVDLRLRPDGMNGPLTSSLPATLEYYEAFGQTWERAALFKARPVGGDLQLGEAFLVEIEPFLYRRTLDYTMIADIERMKSRVEEQEVARGRSERNVKLGPGGIRELEFFVQSFALVRGGRDRRLRERSTLGLLERLVQAELLASDEGLALDAAYRWLRRVEHALQIDEDRQIHVLPVDPDARAVVARRLALHLEGNGPIWERRWVGDPLERFERTHAAHVAVVGNAFAGLFRERRERTMSIADASARALLDELDSPGIAERFAELGFADGPAAVAALRVLRDGAPHARTSVEGRRALQNLIPSLIAVVRASAAPDRALGHLAEFLGRVGARQTFIALLAENEGTLRLLVNLFATSEYLSRSLLQHPELLDTLVRSDLVVAVKSPERFGRELDELLEQADDLEQRLDTLRRFRNDELLRIGIHDIQGELHYEQVNAQLSDLAEVCLRSAFTISLGERRVRGVGPPGQEMAVIAMGKLGGQELNYHSDLDLIFVYGREGAPRGGEDGPSPQEYFAKLAQHLLMVLQLSTREGLVYKIDTRLRPSGRSGPLVTSLESFARYHTESSSVWERQALIRARVVCGPPGLTREIERVLERFVYGRGLAAEELAEIARLRGRIERELAREDTRTVNLKTGRGGLVDIEFVAQALALAHGHTHPEVRGRATGRLLEALGRSGLLSPEDQRTLAEGYGFLRRLESRLRIEGEHPTERIARDPEKLAGVARRMELGEGARAGERLLEEYDRRREGVRRVYDRLVGCHAQA